MNVYSNEQCEKRTYVLRAFPTALYIYILYAEEAQNMPMTSYKTKFKMSIEEKDKKRGMK